MPIHSATENIRQRYQQAESLLQINTQLRTPSLLNIRLASLAPQWIPGSACFFYSRETTSGKQFRLVDALKPSNQQAFDHKQLAQQLSAVAGQPVDPANLPLAQLELDLEGQCLRFDALGQRWQYHLSDQTCEAIQSHPSSWTLSPNGKTAAFVQDHNLWLCDLETGDKRALTDDGEHYHRYASAPSCTGAVLYPIVDLLWSPDSKRIATQRIDTRDAVLGLPLVEHVPADGRLRPGIVDEGRRVAMHGDKTVEGWQLLMFDCERGQRCDAEYGMLPMRYPPYQGFYLAGRGWWSVDSRHVYFVDQVSDMTGTKVLQWDTETGHTSILLEETPERPAILHTFDQMVVTAKPLPETNELIWYSERSGWAHLYLADLQTGAIKNPITEGEWLVRDIIHVDAQRRQLVIKTAGRQAGRNPYYTDICRVNIDTGELTPIISSDHEYQTTKTSVSPCGDFVIATQTRADQIPVHLLLDRAGNSLLTLETADISALPNDWRWPEPVQTVAADGESAIYGIVFRPRDFSPEKSYPVIDFSFMLYPNGLDAFGSLYLESAAYTELGFIVVGFLNRALAGYRARAFHDLQDHSLPFFNLADHVAGTQQLIERYPYMDGERIGVTLHSSYPTALTGLLIYPDFYKVGVCLNPIADTRLMPMAQCGADDFPQYETFAAQLKGKLLLIAGMLDYAIPVSCTFRLVEALQQANKPFDMLMLPNLSHDITGYAKRRQWDYFVEHLLGIAPPDDFNLCVKAEEVAAHNRMLEKGAHDEI